jgi:histidinol-phosphatase (PHP family)
MSSRPLPPDNHVHSEWSWDTGEHASMLAACRFAAESGLPGVAFTEHIDAEHWEPTDGIAVRGLDRMVYPQLVPFDAAGYLACIEECRQRFPQLRILTGVELGEPHLHASTVEAVLALHPFERLLGSLHTVPVEGKLENAWEVLPRATAAEADRLVRDYFAELLHLVRSDVPFEVLAHLDFPRRYWPDGDRPYAERDFEAEYRGVLAELAASGRVMEVNTRSPLASVDLVRWWYEAGGSAVSFGGDAHVPWMVGASFDLAMDVVEAAGFRPGAGRLDFWRR